MSAVGRERANVSDCIVKKAEMNPGSPINRYSTGKRSTETASLHLKRKSADFIGGKAECRRLSVSEKLER